VVLPTICVLGPKLKVIDYLQGGGKSTEIMLVRLAERKLQQRQTRIAEAISEQVIKKDPKNLKARTVKGYAALKQGKLDEAEKTFRDLSKLEGQGEVLGKEGLARTYAKKGEAQKALAAATEVQELAPDRVYPHVVKGDVLSSQDKMTEAEAEYLKAAQKKTAEPYQRAPAYNQLGRLYATRGEYERSRELFDQAVAIDPYYIEATSNKGRTYEKEGKMDKALETYRQALTLDRNDLFASVLAKKAQEMLALQKDVEQKKRVDKLVKELADRYRTRKKSRLKTEDTWTSRPMVLSFVDFQEKGLPERDGLATVLIYKITDQLNASGRVQVVEGVLIERLLEELNRTGSLFYSPTGALLSLRLIDTETSAIPKVVTRQFSAEVPEKKELHRLNRDILRTIMMKYPLCGYVIQATGDQIMINLGSKQGVVLGTKFEVLEEQKPMKYRGKWVRIPPKPVGLIEIARVETDLSYARVLNQERPLKTDDKVKERIVDLQHTGGGNVTR
jgi:tetratricopeptide (TPR) repeat protein